MCWKGHQFVQGCLQHRLTAWASGYYDLSQRKKGRKRAFEEWRFWIVCKDKLSVGVAEDAYDVLLAIAISVYLCCMLLTTWLHPFRMQSWKATRKLWYSGGPPLSFLSLPTPDPARPYGNTTCQECKGFCTDHYLKPNQLVELAKNGDVVPSNKHPSQAIVDAFKQHKGIPPRLKCLNWQPKFFSILTMCKCGWSIYKVCQRTGRKEQGRQPKRGEMRAEKELFWMYVFWTATS